jgi:dienelactone hydrolase
MHVRTAAKKGRWAFLGWLLILTCLMAVAGTDATAYKGKAGPFPVEEILLEWKDARRNRSVPVKIYRPKKEEGAFPLIVFSHGLGGSREGYGYLGSHWASHGYISLHLQHIGSDAAIWRDVPKTERLRAMRMAAADPRNALHRPVDVRFAIDQMVALNRKTGPFKGRIDIGKIGIAGHSFGAHTALLIAGQKLIGPNERSLSFADSRVKAMAAMSAPVPQRKNLLARSYEGVVLPCLHMTGTADHSIVGKTKVEERRLPFDHISGVDQFLIVLKGGDHMVFSGRKRHQGPRRTDPVFHGVIRMSTVAFWDAYLKRDHTAIRWLAQDGLKKALGTMGTVEIK